MEIVYSAIFYLYYDMAQHLTLMKLTQFCSEGFPDDFPFRLVGWVILLYRLHHQVHDVKQHPEICAVSEGDGWFSDSTTTGSTVTERGNGNVRYASADKTNVLQKMHLLVVLNGWRAYSISMLSSSTRAEKVPTSSSRKMLYLIQCCTSASELHSAKVPGEKQDLPL